MNAGIQSRVSGVPTAVSGICSRHPFSIQTVHISKNAPICGRAHEVVVACLACKDEAPGTHRWYLFADCFTDEELAFINGQATIDRRRVKCTS